MVSLVKLILDQAVEAAGPEEATVLLVVQVL
jgi:hypothetical protein